MGARMRLTDEEEEAIRAMRRNRAMEQGVDNVKARPLADIAGELRARRDKATDENAVFTDGDGSDDVFTKGYEEFATPLVVDRHKRIGAMYDVHVPIHDVVATNKAIKWLVEERQIDALLFGGDFADLHSLSAHGKDARRYGLAYELNAIKNQLTNVRRYVGDSFPIYYIEGNHERRYKRKIYQARETLAEMDETGNFGDTSTFEDVIGLRELGITYAGNQMGIQTGNLTWIHGDEIAGGGKNPARLKLSRAKRNIAFGHLHTHDNAVDVDMFGNPIGAWAVGCLAQLTPEWKRYSFWKQGVAFAEFDDNGDFRFENRLFIRGELH